MTFSSRKLIVVAVISDLVTDYRVHKVCQTLHQDGYRVLLVGTYKKNSLPLEPRDYQTHRIKMWFGRSVLFYAEFNLRIFFSLWFRKGDIYLGNDLDTMPAMMGIAGLRRKPLVYDSHEYFLEMAGLQGKPFRRSVWKFVEKKAFAKADCLYTVSESIQEIYRNQYRKEVLLVRNLPYRTPIKKLLSPEEKAILVSIEEKIAGNKKVLIFQGAGINPFRGAEELVQSMLFLEKGLYHLLIIGGGDVFGKLRKLIDQHQLGEKITLVPKVPFSLLSHITCKADLGFSIDKPSLPNQEFSLPNKLFEYLHAGVPVLASRLLEQEKIIHQYDVGGFIENHEPEHIANRIKQIFADTETLERWKRNTQRVREELNWELEGKKIIDIFKQVEKESVK